MDSNCASISPKPVAMASGSSRFCVKLYLGYVFRNHGTTFELVVDAAERSESFGDRNADRNVVSMDKLNLFSP